MANLYDTSYFNPDIKSLSSFFETPQFTEDYTEAGEIAAAYPSTNGGSYKKQGLSSDVRHTLAASTGKDAFIDYISQFGFEPTGKIADLFGNIGITGATAFHEIPDAWNIGQFALDRGDYGAITSGKFLSQPWEDVKANLNVWNIPYDSTEEEKLKQIPTLQAYRRDKRATQKGIAQVAMQRGIREAEAAKQKAAAQAAAAQQVRQNIQTYGNRDRPNTGINRPGGGRGQSPTGGDVAGTPFTRGGVANLLYGGIV